MLIVHKKGYGAVKPKVAVFKQWTKEETEFAVESVLKKQSSIRQAKKEKKSRIPHSTIAAKS